MKKVTRNILKVVTFSLAVTAIASNGVMQASKVLAEGGTLAYEAKRFESNYKTMEECIAAGLELNEEIAAEGFVLLKNENDALPFDKSVTKVTVLGEHADEPSIGGGGSGGQGRPNVVGGVSPASEKAASIYESLEAVGIQANPFIRERYLQENPVTFSVPGSFGSLYREHGHYMDKVSTGGNGAVEFAGNYYKSINSGGTLSGAESANIVYNDAAIVVLSRTGSEGADAPARNVPGHEDVTDHYMELNDAEKELMAYAKANFKKVIVVLNTPSVMEVGDLQNDESVSSILWIGQPGWNGMMAVGKLLTGEINPSGKTVDLWMTKFESDPTWYNSGNYSQADYIINGSTNITGPNTIQMAQDPSNLTAPDGSDRALDYAEGIYAGYRYYETVAHDIGGANGEQWYKDNVTYSFGHGLSYTSFEKRITDVSGDLSNPDGKVVVSIQVKNTGRLPGKDVAQVYVTKPYTAGGIEKAAIDLVGFEKTKKLKPGEVETVKVEINVKDFASFDYNDANGNNNAGYELETGDYVISLRNNSHDVEDTRALTATQALAWDEDGNPTTVNNIYSQTGNNYEMYNTLAHHWTVEGVDHYLKRSQLVKDGAVVPFIDNQGRATDLGKQLGWLVAERDEDGFTQNVFTEKALKLMHLERDQRAYQDNDNLLTAEIETDYINAWTKTAADIPSTWRQGTGVIDPKTNRYAIELYDMAGVPLSDTEKWDEFMNQLTWDELCTLVKNNGSYKTVGLESVGKPQVVDQDGPGQLKNSSVGTGMAWACEVVVASTWNKDLAYQQGKICGNESILLNQFGWYGPAMNNHRNPLSGRNFEYYSQDGVQGGIIAGNVIRGATDMGCHVYAKHAFMNDQETNRMNTATFATEQAIREIYAKPFEYAIKEGNSNGTMTAFNHIGIASSLSYATNIQLYENEWGFEGYSCTDMYTGQANAYWTMNTMIRGNTIALGTGSNGTSLSNSKTVEGTYDAARNMVVVKNADGTKDIDSPTQYYAVRTLAQRILYVTANGNAMDNGMASYMIDTGDLEFMVGQKIASKDILSEESREQLAGVFGDSGYTVTVTGLPSGVSINADGILSGTPTATGNARLSITVQGKFGLSYIKTTKTVNVSVVASNFTDATLSNTNATLLNDFSAQIAQSKVELTSANYVANGQANQANLGKYIAVEYEATGLPEGLTVNKATGAISGQAKVVGDFDVTVVVKLYNVQAKVTQSWFGQRTTYSKELAEEIKGSYTISVTGGYNVTINGNYTDSNPIVIGVADGQTISVSDLIDLANLNYNRGAGFSVVGFVTADNQDLSAGDINAATTLSAKWEFPEIAIIDGNWYINGVNTGIKAAGTNGTNGTNGANGTNGLNGKDGIDGVDGVNGIDGEKGDKGDKGDTGAAGASGANGVGVANIKVVDGKYVFTMTDGSSINVDIPSEEKKGGCGGSIIAVSSLVGALGLGAVALAIKKKKEDK